MTLEEVSHIAKWVVKLSVPAGDAGSAFVASRFTDAEQCALWTAKHVFDHIHGCALNIRCCSWQSSGEIIVGPSNYELISDLKCRTESASILIPEFHLPSNTLFAPISDAEVLVDQEVGLLGFVSGSEQICLKHGIVKEIRPNGLPLVIVDGESEPGMSGGPWFHKVENVWKVFGINHGLVNSDPHRIVAFLINRRYSV